MYFIGLGTATPTNCYRQDECWEAIRLSGPFAKLNSRAQAILKKVLLGDNGISTRYASVDLLQESLQMDPDILQARFTRHAPAVATQAAQNALRDAGITVHEIDAVIISTCTGYLCPGLTSYVSEQLGLRPNVLALDLVGQGCGAAIPNLTTAHALIQSGHSKKILSICVEICSAAFYLDNDPGVLISACLFGDGAGAAVLSNEPLPGRRQVKWKLSGSQHSVADRDFLRFEHRNGLLRNVLSPKVPQLAAKNAEHVLQETLQRAGVSRQEINGWIFHAGGRDVLIALQKTLNLDSTDLCLSAKILKDYGNLSSPFVYFVLQATLQANRADGLWWMASFGAGFSSHGVLLEVHHAESA